jgi:hypothetical protein
VGPELYDFNSTHCVQAYELNRRGVEVEATPLPAEGLPGMSTAGGRPLAEIEQVWGVQFQTASPREIKRAFKKSRGGARGIVAVRWRFGGGHVFNVETVGRKVRFVDGQTGDSDVSRYFKLAVWCAYLRTDNAEPRPGIWEFAKLRLEQ